MVAEACDSCAGAVLEGGDGQHEAEVVEFDGAVGGAGGEPGVPGVGGEGGDVAAA